MSESGSAQRRVALVVGADPEPTATVAGALAALGAGDLASPATGRWVRGLHADLLARSGVEVDDARPAAWFETGKACANGITRARLAQWLGGRFVHEDGDRAGQPRPDVVVADPALPWFLGLWRAAALRCDAQAVPVVVLQPPVPTDAGRVAAWLNTVLHVERATRDSPRVLLPYADVVRDWTVPFVALGRDLGLRSVQEATANQIRRGHDVVAAGPPAASDLAPGPGVPPPLLDLAGRTWAALTGEAPDPAALDRLRADYLELYAAAESITGSSLRAAVRADRTDRTDRADRTDRSDPAAGATRRRAGTHRRYPPAESARDTSRLGEGGNL